MFNFTNSCAQWVCLSCMKEKGKRIVKSSHVVGRECDICGKMRLCLHAKACEMENCKPTHLIFKELVNRVGKMLRNLSSS